MKNFKLVLGFLLAMMFCLLGSCAKEKTPETGSIQGIVISSTICSLATTPFKV